MATPAARRTFLLTPIELITATSSYLTLEALCAANAQGNLSKVKGPCGADGDAVSTTARRHGSRRLFQIKFRSEIARSFFLCA
jgi:hypothetical protein